MPANRPDERIVLDTVVLTRLREADGPDVAAAVCASLDHLRPWMPWANEVATSDEHQRTRARAAEDLWDEGDDFLYVLRPAEGGPVLGSFGLHRRLGPDALEIGYWLHVDHTGRGYATAAAAALTRAALAMAGIDRVEIHTDETNTASAAVPQRLGYRLARVDQRPPEAPAESTRLQIWSREAAPVR